MGGALCMFYSSHDPHIDVRGECKASEHQIGTATRVAEETTQGIERICRGCSK